MTAWCRPWGRFSVLVVLAALLVGLGPAAGAAEDAPPAQAANALDQYPVRPGDRLQLSCWGQPDLTTDTLVMPDGSVALPLLGRVQVSGQTIPALTQMLQEAYSRYYKNPQMTVAVIPRYPPQVYVEGDVGRPGPVEYDPGRGIMDYLGLAGGLGPGADLTRVVISSGGAKTVVNVSGASSGEMPTIRPGDAIWVGRALGISVLGMVNRPGAFEYQPTLRLSDYLAMAGGPSPGADLSEVTVSPGPGQTATQTLDLSPGAQTEGDASNNPLLNPGDTVWVAKALEVSVLGAVRQPGAFDYRPGVRLTEYVGMAGGPTNRARLHKSVLKHTDADGKSTVRVINIAQALGRPDQPDLNPVLAPGDVVTVPEEFVGGTLEWADILRAAASILLWTSR